MRAPALEARGRTATVAGLLFGILSCAGPASPDSAYAEEIETYRASREERLREPDGWLTLLGLHWLEPGETTIGTAGTNRIVLPEGAAPAMAGRFIYQRGSVRLVAEPGVDAVVVDGRPVGEVSFDHPADQPPPSVRLGRLQILVIERSGRHAVRIKDPENPALEAFAGIDYYPIRPEFRVRARLRRYDEPKLTEVATVVDIDAPFLAPGELEFEIGGKPLTLLPLVSAPTDTELFIIFKDGTSGTETYHAGRYLYATLEGDEAVVDFNKAYNPPCAFTAFATCPLPPPQNRLKTPIRAGEKRYGK